MSTHCHRLSFNIPPPSSRYNGGRPIYIYLSLSLSACLSGLAYLAGAGSDFPLGRKQVAHRVLARVQVFPGDAVGREVRGVFGEVEDVVRRVEDEDLLVDVLGGPVEGDVGSAGRYGADEFQGRNRIDGILGEELFLAAEERDALDWGGDDLV